MIHHFIENPSLPGPHAGDCAHKGLSVASSVLVPQLHFLVTISLSMGLAKGHRVHRQTSSNSVQIRMIRFLQAKARM